ncbi:hypothetical protein BC828DRAFT_414386 [Blastocladiella britannica]|nr:hypothetical protein BC828DRAFT_414386 [Blastocladiella britannica]
MTHNSMATARTSATTTSSSSTLGTHGGEHQPHRSRRQRASRLLPHLGPMTCPLTPTSSTATAKAATAPHSGSQWTTQALPWAAAAFVLLVTVVLAVTMQQLLTDQQDSALQTTLQFRCSQHATKLSAQLNAMAEQMSYIRSYLLMSPSWNMDMFQTYGNSLLMYPFLRYSVLQKVTAAQRPAWEAAYNKSMQHLRSPLFVDAPSATFLEESRSWPPEAVDDIMREALAAPRYTAQPPPPNSSVTYWPIVRSLPLTPALFGVDANIGARIGAINAVMKGTPLASVGPVLLSTPVQPNPVNTSASLPFLPGWVIYSPPLTLPDGSVYLINLTLDLKSYTASTMQGTAENAHISMTMAISNVTVTHTVHARPPVPVVDGINMTFSSQFTFADRTVTVTCVPLRELLDDFASSAPVLVPMFILAGGFVCMMGAFVLTERMAELWKAESLLDNWQSSAEAILKALPNPLVLVDDIGTVLGVNEALLFLTGLVSVAQVNSLDAILKVPPPPPSPPSPTLLPETGSHQKQNLNDRLPTATRTPLALAESVAIDMSQDPVPIILAASRLDVMVISNAKPTLIEMEAGVAGTPDHPEISHVIVLTDMSELRARDRALAAHVSETARLQQMQKSLLLYLVHELRNPLYVIQGWADEVLATEGDDDLGRSTVQCADGITDLLDVAVEYLEHGLANPILSASTERPDSVPDIHLAFLSHSRVRSTATDYSDQLDVAIGPETPVLSSFASSSSVLASMATGNGRAIGGGSAAPTVSRGTSPTMASTNPTTTRTRRSDTSPMAPAVPAPPHVPPPPPENRAAKSPTCLAITQSTLDTLRYMKSLATMAEPPYDDSAVPARLTLSHWCISFTPRSAMTGAVHSGTLTGSCTVADWIPEAAATAFPAPFAWLISPAGIAASSRVQSAVLHLAVLARRAASVGGSLSVPHAGHPRELALSVPFTACFCSHQPHGAGESGGHDDSTVQSAMGVTDLLHVRNGAVGGGDGGDQGYRDLSTRLSSISDIEADSDSDMYANDDNGNMDPRQRLIVDLRRPSHDCDLPPPSSRRGRQRIGDPPLRWRPEAHIAPPSFMSDGGVSGGAASSRLLASALVLVD